MKRKFNLKSAIVMFVLAFVVFCTDASAQRRNRAYVADSGIIYLQSNQKLRVFVNTRFDDEAVNFQFRRCRFLEQADGGVTLASTQISDLITIAPGDGKFFDIFIESSFAVRARVASPTQNMVVTFQIINTINGEVIDTETNIVDAADYVIWRNN